MYKNYIFDLYGTLVDIHTDESQPVLWEKLALFYGYYGAIYTPEELQKEYGAIVKEEEVILKGILEEEKEKYSHEANPEIQIEYVFQKLFEKKGVKADLDLSIHAGQFFRAMSTEYVRLYDGVKEMLHKLKEQGKKVYLLSNAQRIFTEYEMRMLGIYDSFDGVLISSECRCKKPDLRFFEMIFDQFHLEKKESIMIGNDDITDIAGAHNAGIDSFYIYSNISPEIRGELLSTYSMMEMDIPKMMEMLQIG